MSPPHELRPPPLPAPRIWTALLVGPLAIIAAIFLAGTVTALAMIAFGGVKSVIDGANPMQVIERLAVHPLGIALLVLPGQLTFLGAAVGAGLLSPHPLRSRLGLVRTILPWWTIPVLALATLFFGAAGGMIIERIFPGPHEQLEIFIKMAKMPGDGMFIITVVMLSVLPALTEETLFRGYMQGRLLQRWPVAGAIATSTVVFALGHVDPIHVLAVLPVGVWLGIIAWRCRSVWPGMICHAAMNAVSFTAMRFGDPHDPTITPPVAFFLVLSGLAVVASLFIFKRYAAASFAPSADQISAPKNHGAG